MFTYTLNPNPWVRRIQFQHANVDISDGVLKWPIVFESECWRKTMDVGEIIKILPLGNFELKYNLIKKISWPENHKLAMAIKTQIG